MYDDDPEVELGGSQRAKTIEELEEEFTRQNAAQEAVKLVDSEPLPTSAAEKSDKNDKSNDKGKRSTMKDVVIATGITGVLAAGYFIGYPLLMGRIHPANSASPVVLAPVKPLSSPKPLFGKQVEPSVLDTGATPLTPSPNIQTKPNVTTANVISATDSVATAKKPSIATPISAMLSSAQTVSSSTLSTNTAPKIAKEAVPLSTASMATKFRLSSAPAIKVTGKGTATLSAPSASTKSVNNEITVLTGTVAQMQTKYSLLEEQFKVIEQQLKNIQASSRVNTVNLVAPVHHAKQLPAYHPVYHPVYHAEVKKEAPKAKPPVVVGAGNGMAWVSSNGKVTEVHVGSYYHGLGTITSINTDGSVTGSEGKAKAD